MSQTLFLRGTKANVNKIEKKKTPEKRTQGKKGAQMVYYSTGMIGEI